MSIEKPTVVLLGKLPPPYMGPSIATEIILNSSLNEQFNIVHLDTKAYSALEEIGKWSFSKLYINFKLYIKLISLINKNNPEIIWIPISQSTAGFIKDSIFIWIAKIKGKKVLLHLRGSNFKNWLEKSSFLTKSFVKSTVKKSDGVIVLGKKLKYLFDDLLPEEKIFVVPNGGNYTIPERGVNRDKTGIIYIANLQESKGIIDVLEALAILQKTHSGKFSMEIIGGWRSEETKQLCLNIINSNNLPVVIYPSEKSREKFNFLSSSDIFVFTPRKPEGHPWVLVEAMAAGLPVISTDQGAITESVIDNENGFIVEVCSPEQIADRLKNLIDNTDLRQRMGELSRKKYLAEFTENAMTSNLARVLKSI
jgi:glycosyltransferase involved in cell wall biosynthesis